MKELKSWNYLSEEMQEEILVRLPLKSLMRFKSVCKSSQSQIKSRSFVEFHRSRHPTTANNKSVVHSSIENLPVEMTELKKPPFDRYAVDEILGEEEWKVVTRTMGPINNSIYCVVTNLQSDGRVSFLTGKIAFCNPYTHNYKFTKPLTCESKYDNYLLSELARQQCRVHYGFGFADDNYKVVVVISWGRQWSSFLSFVYSANNSTWRKIVDYEFGERNFCETKTKFGYPEIAPVFESCPQRFYRGCWHWMAFQPGFPYPENSQNWVLAFDFSTDAFTSFKAPNYYFSNEAGKTTEYYAKGAGVVVMNDHLAAIFTSIMGTYVDVWMMMEYGNEETWTKIHAIHPNYYGYFSRLRGMFWEARRSEDDDNGGGYAVTGMGFKDEFHKLLIYCDDSVSVHQYIYADLYYVFWNTPGISTYMETIEPV